MQRTLLRGLLPDMLVQADARTHLPWEERREEREEWSRGLDCESLAGLDVRRRPPAVRLPGL